MTPAAFHVAPKTREGECSSVV